MARIDFCVVYLYPRGPKITFFSLYGQPFLRYRPSAAILDLVTLKFQIGQNGQNWLLCSVLIPLGAQNKLIFALRPAVSEIQAICGHLGIGDLDMTFGWPWGVQSNFGSIGTVYVYTYTSGIPNLAYFCSTMDRLRVTGNFNCSIISLWKI